MKEESGEIDINDTLVLDPNVKEAEAYKYQNDRDMFPLTEQLQQHLRSMDTNSQLIAGIPDWMATVRDAVGDVLREAEDESVYDKAMGIF